MDYQPLSRAAILDILALLAAADGKSRGTADETLWAGVSVQQRWQPDEVVAAITELACRWTGEYGGQITPGMVTAEVRRTRSQPRPFAEQEAEDAARGVVVPPEERRRELMAWVAEQVTAKAMPDAHPPEGEVDPYVAARRAGFTPPDWAAISSCGHCDERGMSLADPELVCPHPRTGDVPNQGCDDGVGSGAHPTTEQENDHDSS